MRKILSTDTNAKMTYMLQLSEKEFKEAIMKMLHKIRASTLKTN
jgi:3-methyladenine DNA glycosylase Tag